MNKSLLLLLATLIGFSYVPHAQAVFCTVHKYAMPGTDKQLWLLGDVHVDIDPMQVPTRIHQHTLLQEAKKHNGLVIAENVHFSRDLRLYALAGVNGLVLFKSLYYNQYLETAAGIALFPLIAHLLNCEKEQSKKPDLSINEYLQKLKANRGITQLQFYLCTPMHSLVEKCADWGISAIDSEFRFHMPTTLVGGIPWFQQANKLAAYVDIFISRTITGNKMRYPRTLADYCQTNDTVIQEINDAALYNPELRSFYKHCLNLYHQSYITQGLRALAEKDATRSLATILPALAQKTGTDNDVMLFSDFAVHNMALFDARVLNSIYNNRDRETIFVCTGVSHMDNIADGLKKLGYQKVASFGDGNLKKLEELGVIGGCFIAKKDIDYLILDLEKIFAQETAYAKESTSGREAA